METKTKVLIGCIVCMVLLVILAIVGYIFRVELGIVKKQPSPPVKIIFYSQPDFKGNASSKFNFNYVSGGKFCSSYSINNSASSICKNEDGTALTYNYNSSTPQLNFVPLSVKFFNRNDNEISAPNDLKLTLYGWNGGNGASQCGGAGSGVWRQILGGDPARYKSIGFDAWVIANANAGYVSFNT